MFKDVLIPSRIGNYYLFRKRILSIEITPVCVQAMLLYFNGTAIKVRNSIKMQLKDFSSHAVTGALKKIATGIGAYDEIVTVLPSSDVIYKELELPFIGREKLEMVVPYEVEGMLPFSLEEAVIDFITIDENKTKKSSKVLVAAALKDEVTAHLAYFKKAELAVQVVVVDMFVLYDFYHWGLYNKKSDMHTQMLVDVGFDVTRVLYFHKGLLISTRMIPQGVSDIAQKLSADLAVSYYDIIDQFGDDQAQELYQDRIVQELQKLLQEVSRTITFVQQKDEKLYAKPQQLLFSGRGKELLGFKTTAQNFFDFPVECIEFEHAAKHGHVKVPRKLSCAAECVLVCAAGLFARQYSEVNLLKSFALQSDIKLLRWQLIMALLLMIAGFTGTWWYSSAELAKWNQSYIASKKQLVQTIEEHMNIDAKSARSVKDIVSLAQETLDKEHKLWFSFSQQTEKSFLEYLQDISTKIDKESLGLSLKKVSMKHDLVTLDGTVKSFEALEVFEDELSELDMFTLVEKPRELTFSVQLKVKPSKKEGTQS